MYGRNDELYMVGIMDYIGYGRNYVFMLGMMDDRNDGLLGMIDNGRND